MTLFPSIDLAARIERAECSLLDECIAVVGPRDTSLPSFTTPIGGGLAAYAGSSSPLNKIAGLGFGAPPSDVEFDAIEHAFDERGIAVQVEISCLADPSIAERLTRRGYVLMGFENVLGLAIPAEPRDVAAEIEIEENHLDDLDTWIDLFVTGFASPDIEGIPSHEEFPREAMEQAMRDMVLAPSFHRHLARLDGQPAGGSSMRIDAGIMQLCGAATLPACRRRGVQSALLEERLMIAGASGCDLATVVTLPGSRSQENVQRRGFELLYTRAMLVRTPPGG